MPEQFDSRYFRGQGALFIGGRDAAGKPTGLTFIGDLSSAALTPDIERGQIIENVSGAGAVAASWLSRSGFGLSIVMRSIKPEHLAEALHATSTAKAAGSVTDEAHVAYLGKFIALAHPKVSAVVVTNQAGTTTYVAGADYTLHADSGMVEVLAGGAIVDASQVLIDYQFADQHHIQVEPQNLEKYLVFAGTNTADNDKHTRCELYRVKLDPSVLSLITQEAAEMTINGLLMRDTLRTAGDQFYSWKTED